MLISAKASLIGNFTRFKILRECKNSESVMRSVDVKYLGNIDIDKQLKVIRIDNKCYTYQKIGLIGSYLAVLGTDADYICVIDSDMYRITNVIKTDRGNILRELYLLKKQPYTHKYTSTIITRSLDFYLEFRKILLYENVSIPQNVNMSCTELGGSVKLESYVLRTTDITDISTINSLIGDIPPNAKDVRIVYVYRQDALKDYGTIIDTEHKQVGTNYIINSLTGNGSYVVRSIKGSNQN